MKKILFAIATFVLVGCSNQSEVALPVDKTPETNQIRIWATVNNAITRAGNDGDNLSAFTLMIINPTNSAYSYNKQMIKVDDQWVSNDGQPMLWDAMRSEVLVMAIAPSQSATPEATLSVEVKSDQSLAANVEASDFLLMKQRVNPEDDLTDDGKLKVSMNHLMSKLLIRFTLDGAAEGVDFSKIGDMAINGAVLSGVCNLSADLPEVTTKDDVEATTLIPYKEGVGYECIVVPQTIATDFSLNFSYDGKLYIWNSAESLTFQQGVEHTLVINIKTSSVAPTAIKQARCIATNQIVEW